MCDWHVTDCAFVLQAFCRGPSANGGRVSASVEVDRREYDACKMPLPHGGEDAFVACMNVAGNRCRHRLLELNLRYEQAIL